MFLHTKLETRTDPINIAFIGCGKFVSMFLAQYNHLNKIQIDSIVDININQAKKNCLNSGLSSESIDQINFSNSLDKILDRNIEIFIEANGNPIIGTVHSDKIIKNKKNVILVNVEADITCGKYLSDLAKKNKTGVVFANKNIELAKKISKLIQTNYYFIENSDDLRGIEICAAIKNFYSMIIGSANELNTAALLLQRSLFEMRNFVKLLGGSESSVYGLAGLGDLYVSSAGGRNSKMGQYLGQGQIYTEAKTKFMSNETIEGAELAFQIGSKVLKDFPQKDFPLLHSLLDALCNNKKFNLKL